MIYELPSSLEYRLYGNEGDCEGKGEAAVLASSTGMAEVGKR